MGEIGVNEAQDILDSTRLSYSSESPSSRTETQPLIDQVHDIFLGRWSKYIPQDQLGVVSLSIQNPILTDKEGMRTPLNPKEGIAGILSKLETRGDIDGHTEWINGLSVIKQFPYKTGLDRYSPKQLDSMLNIFKGRFGGDVKKTRSFVERYYFQTIHSHESAHASSDESIPNYFQEIGARYYQIETMKTIYGENELFTSNDVKNHNFYNELISKFGDAVHSYFFGGETDSRTRRKLLANALLFLGKDTAKEAFRVEKI